MSNPLQLKEKDVPEVPEDESTLQVDVGNETKKNGFWLKIKKGLKTTKGKFILTILLVFIIVLSFAGYVAYTRYIMKAKLPWEDKSTLPAISFSQGVTEKKSKSPLDGILYLEAVASRHPLAIMVENHPDARPQSGLDKAKIVYEAITEGGITRFMAVFGPESTSRVGPVRSARTFFLDWAKEYDAFYAHVGGNLDALELIPEIGIKDLDQFRYGNEAYWRIPQASKATEHTMYADTDKLWAIAVKNKWDMASDFQVLGFKKEAPIEQRPELSSITIDFSAPNYKVKWVYDRPSNSYKREMAGILHKDAISGEQLTTKNVIVQEVERWNAPTIINESGWAMQTIGEGKSKIFMDGKMYEGFWKKTSRTDRTRFYRSNGEELQFNPGSTWVEIVPPEVSVIAQ